MPKEYELKARVNDTGFVYYKGEWMHFHSIFLVEKAREAGELVIDKEELPSGLIACSVNPESLRPAFERWKHLFLPQVLEWGWE